MAISFSRSMRSLQSDSFRLSLVTLIIASILIAAWFAWLVFAPVTLYESSQDWEETRDGSLLAHFSVDTISQFKPGQVVVIDARTKDNQSTQLTGMVADVPMRTQNHLASDTIKISLTSANALPEGTTSATVKVAVATVSPLTLLTRASGQAAK